MGTAVDDGYVPDRIYVHQLNLTSADIVRRQKEKEMVEEEKRKVKEMKEIKRRQREEEKKRDMEMLLTYNPWGKPGAGAKGEETKRQIYPEGRVPDETDEASMEEFIKKFGRPGNGAPNRTESGRIKTQITGDPAIRFQDTQHVRLSIENHLRYQRLFPPVAVSPRVAFCQHSFPALFCLFVVIAHASVLTHDSLVSRHAAPVRSR
ncbi:uncharacterized protein TNIN_229581 [Trichonephila inaurata madagascariensis]|uniref:Uncharacterized protein n=1 Tax=Trichonephila inaurata madagascariensis TaxID=2747483 RepID=A0A8X6YBT1_9ARAC|nr:uncharacterized protein TNIN_229581 [Trichonephila inaurata madagascariensis]